MRGMAVLMVMVSHFLQIVAGPASPYGTHLAASLPRFPQLGQKGVDLFFVLSGFLITGILLRTKGSSHYFKNFYIRRSLRIFPLYFAFVIGGMVVGAIWANPELQWRNNWWYLCYLQNVGIVFWPGKIAGPLHFWSLAVEEHFYLFWPLVVLWLNRRQLVFFSLFVIVLSAVMRTAFESWGLNYVFFTLCRMNTLACGAMLAVLFANPPQWEVTKKWALWLLLPLAGVTFGASFVFSSDRSPLAAMFKFILYTAFCGLILIVSLATVRWNPVRWLFQMGWLRHAGKISYAMYVFHPLIFGQVICRFFQSGWSPVQGRFGPALGVELVLAFGLTVLVSQISQVAFERPILKLKDYFQYEDKSAPLAKSPRLAAAPQ